MPYVQSLKTFLDLVFISRQATCYIPTSRNDVGTAVVQLGLQL